MFHHWKPSRSHRDAQFMDASAPERTIASWVKIFLWFTLNQGSKNAIAQYNDVSEDWVFRMLNFGHKCPVTHDSGSLVLRSSRLISGILWIPISRNRTRKKKELGNLLDSPRLLERTNFSEDPIYTTVGNCAHGACHRY